MSNWLTDGARRWWRAREHRGAAVRCVLCDWAFDSWDDGGRCWRCGAEPRHRAAWEALAARPELLREAERVVQLSPQYGLRNRIARESGFELVTVAADPERANVAFGVLPPGSFDGAVVTEDGDEEEAERLVRAGGWISGPAGLRARRAAPTLGSGRSADGG